MPPRKALPPTSTATSKQKKFKPPFLIPPPSPHPPAPQSSAGESQPSQSQGGDEDIVTLGQILESMMKVSKDRRARRRKDIEGGYRDGLAKAEGKAWAWIEGLRVREHRRQLTTLAKLKMLLAKKKAIEDNILAAVEAMEGACESFGTALGRNVSIGLAAIEGN